MAPGALPDDLLRRARDRIDNLVFVLLLLSLVGVLFSIISQLTGLVEPGVAGIGMAAHFAIIVCDVILLALARAESVANRTVMTAALAYQVGVCAITNMSFPVMYFLGRDAVPPPMWSSILIVVFPLVVPSPPRRAVATSLLAAATAPASLWILDYLGHVRASTVDFAEWMIGSAIVVVIASFGARLVYGLQRDVARARQLGSYQLVELIGAGGMGEVWQASHRMLARPAAVKLIKRDVLDEKDLDTAEKLRLRFEREAQATAQLESPHTVELYDFGVSDEGDFYYVMELLNGITLETLVKQYGPVPPGRAVAILRQVCDSLEDAHAHKLIHRDIKPANIFLARVGGKHDFAKVLDFGLVKSQADPAGATDVYRTTDNKLRGTPAFMAPELVTRDDVDARADIYSLGCVGYWLLSGALVFQEDTAMATALAHARTEPAPLSERTEVPIAPALEELIMRCLAKEPGERPQSAAELGDLLEALDVPRWTERDARAWWDDHLASASQPKPATLDPMPSGASLSSRL